MCSLSFAGSHLLSPPTGHCCRCDDPDFRALKVASLVVILVVAMGMPLLFALLLRRAHAGYAKVETEERLAVARHLATTMQVDLDTARMVMRDVHPEFGPYPSLQ